MIDFGFIKPAVTVLSLVAPSFRRLGAERRAARNPEKEPPNHADQIYEDAFRHLGAINEEDPIWTKVIGSTSSKFVSPADFRKPHVREWLSRVDTKRDLKALAKRSLTNDEAKNTGAKTRLISTYLGAPTENENRAESVIQTAVAVLRHRLHAATQDLGTAAYVQEGFEGVHRRLDTMELPPLVSVSRDTPAPSDSDAQIDVSAVHQSFGEASRLLLGWPQDTDGRWIDRPELNELYGRATQGESTLTVLLGRPGVGKSAILARLGMRLREEGVTLLAIKADQVPPSCSSLDGIDEWIGCDGVQDALRQLAETRQVVVLIDQLDALADLMDQRSDRLTALLQLVGSIRAMPNVRVILSCREFEYRNDVRLSTLGAEAVTLEPPPWEAVAPLLSEYGVAIEQLGEEQRQVLRTPQHLKVFIQYFAKRNRQPVFSTYQALLDHVVRENLHKGFGQKTVLAAERVATEMASDEELWVARSRFSADYEDELRNLVVAEVLVESENGLSIAFRHQTVFDFFRARAFLGSGRSLAEYILTEKQESLFVRPVLWSALTYLRESDRAMYRREFGRLWGNEELRLHLRLLLAAFLGQLPNPDEVEAGWLLPKLHDAQFSRRTLFAMAGSLGWFERVRNLLPGLMSAGPEQASNLTPLLGRALAFARDDVLSLIEKYWLGREQYRAAVYWGVIHDLTSWDRRTVDMAAQHVEQATDGFSDDNNQGLHIAKLIAKYEPEMAPVVLFRYCQAQTNRMTAVSGSGRHSTDRAIAAVLGSGGDWYGADGLATKAPKAFIVEGWTWLKETLEGLATDPSPVFVEYRDCHHVPHLRNGETLWSAFEAAIGGFAESDPAEFLVFVNENEHIDLKLVHRLLALGLERVASKNPRAVVDYLLGDPRRFAIGSAMNRHRLTCGLIAAATPKAANVNVRRLEQAILNWDFHADLGEEPERRFHRMKWIREARMKLLRSIPHEKSSPETRDFLRKEERALPYIEDRDEGPVRASIIGSPMSAEQMVAAADDHIVNLFSELTDDTEGYHSRRRMELIGGTVQASGAFAEFAKQCPDRALNIIERFQPGRQERPAGQALAALGDSDVSPEVLIDYVLRLHDRGFASNDFLRDAASCLSDVASRNKGLDDNTCELLEHWLTDVKPSTESSAPGTFNDIEQTDTNVSDSAQPSLLWDAGGLHILPHGNFPVLRALVMGYLYRGPMDADGCLGVLDRHVDRMESDEVWVAMMQYLPYLEGAHRQSALTFLHRLFEARPGVLYSQMAVRMAYRSLSWISDSIMELTINAWLTGSWPQGPQAAGEVAMVLHLREPECLVARERVERMIEGAEFEASVAERVRIGLAHTLRVALPEPGMRPLATDLLIRLMSVRNDPLSKAISWIFLDEDAFPPDQYTEQILLACNDSPHMLVADRDKPLLDRLGGLLANSWNPLLIHAVARTYLECRNQRGRHSGPEMLMDASLVELALTFHRLPATRTEGLDLFEHLLASSSYDAEDRLKTLDRRAP